MIIRSQRVVSKIELTRLALPEFKLRVAHVVACLKRKELKAVAKVFYHPK